MSKPAAISKRISRNSRTRQLDGVPTGRSEYQDIISKLGGVILQYDIHAKEYMDSTPFQPCKGCVKPKPKNWLATQLSRNEYRKLAEMQQRWYDELLDFNKDIAVENDRNANQLRFSPYNKTEYQAAYGQYKPARWITRRVLLD